MTTDEWLKRFQEETRKLEKRYIKIYKRSLEINDEIDETMNNEKLLEVLYIIKANNDIDEKIEELKKEAVVLKYLIDNNIEIMDEIEDVSVN